MLLSQAMSDPLPTYQANGMGFPRVRRCRSVAHCLVLGTSYWDFVSHLEKFHIQALKRMISLAL